MTASSPSRHCATTSMSGSSASRLASRSRASGSSSTISVLIFFMMSIPSWWWSARPAVLTRQGCDGMLRVPGIASRSARRPRRRTAPAGGASTRHGNATTTASPGCWRWNSNRKSAPNRCCSRSRVVDTPMPFCSARQPSSDSPTPSSRTSIQSLSPSRRAVIWMWPGPAFRATPCLMAFSTSGCRIRFGTQRVERFGLDVESHGEAIGESRLFDLRGTSTGTRAPP